MWITWDHFIKIVLASSLVGDTPVVGMMDIRIGKCLQTRNKTSAVITRTSFLIRSMLQQLKVLPAETYRGPWETAAWLGCHLRFHKREGNPSSERLRDSPKVTSKSVGRSGALPTSGSPALVCCVFLKLNASPSRNSILLSLSAGSTLRNRQWKGPFSNFTVKKPHKYLIKVNIASNKTIDVLCPARWHIFSVIVFPNPRISVSWWKNTSQPQIEGCFTKKNPKTWPLSLKVSRSWKSRKPRKNRNCHRRERTKGTQWLNECGVPDGLLEQKKVISGKQGHSEWVCCLVNNV